MLVLIDQVIHFLLERIDDQIELVTLVDQLANRGQSGSELELLTVELGSELVTHGHGLDLLLMDINQVVVLFSTLILQDVDFVLKDLDTLLHLCQILTRCLNLTDVLVSRILHLFI